MSNCKIAHIEPTGDCNMYRAVICIDNHYAAIIVVGKDINECAKRAVIVVDAFNSPHEKELT